MKGTLLVVLALCAAPCLGLKSGLGHIMSDIERGSVDLLEHLNPFGSESKHTKMWMQQVGKHPRVYYFHNFLSEEERAHMIRLAAPMMKRSTVSGNQGEGVVDEIRTSYGMFIRRLEDPIIERIEKRISISTQIPVSHQEDIQVLRYTHGQKYGAHYDSGYDDGNDNGPHYRLATFLMYLSDVEEGGETAFPEKSEWVDPAMAKSTDTMSSCAKGHVAAKPKAGDAVLFYSYFPNKTMDPASMHTGCPVIKGIKWAAPVWIHIDEFEPQDLERRSRGHEVPHEPGLCEDLEVDCPKWAAAGECESNKEYMTGYLSTQAGACPKSCKVCSGCKDGDIECIHANRKKLGFLQVDKKEMEWLGVPWWYGGEPSPEL